MATLFTRVKPLNQSVEETFEEANKESQLPKSQSKGLSYFLSFRVGLLLQEISIIGIKYTANNGISFIRRLLWISVILFGFGFMIFQLQDRFSYYFKYDTTSKAKFIYNKHLRFPTITICNENRFFLSKARAGGLNLYKI